MIFNNGDRPKYSLLTDGCHGSTQYVYQVSFMGETYTPTPEHYSYNITEAHKKAATYVLQQIDPWMKRKIVEMVNGNNGYLTKQTNGYGNQKTTSE
uniref:Uncharacterized protein n=1 Tax=Ciona savignyi TaxID=51511 RepID=H2Z6Y0_CIOSA